MPLIFTVMVNSNGSVWAESIYDITMSTWCLNSDRNWPYESIKCDIQIQLEQSLDANLKPLNNTFHIIPRVSVHCLCGDVFLFVYNVNISLYLSLFCPACNIIWLWRRWMAYKASENHIKINIISKFPNQPMGDDSQYTECINYEYWNNSTAQFSIL